MNYDPKYQPAIDFLNQHPSQIIEAWNDPLYHEAGSLFGYACKNNSPLSNCGCLTFIKEGNYDAETPELTAAIRADSRIPSESYDITINHLPIFAEWQTRIDKELGRK